MARALAFLVVATAILGGLHWYLWARLVRDPAVPEPWRRLLGVALVLGVIALPAAMFVMRALPSAASRTLAAAAFTWMGVAFLIFTAVLLTDLVRLVGAGLEWMASLVRDPGPPPDAQRRVFLARAAAGTALVAAGGATTLAFHTATSDPEIHEVPVKLERLPRALSGLTIAQITDLHVGPTIQERHVRRVVDLTNGLRPDVVAITGDLVDGSVEELRTATEHLGRLKARYGVYFVTGNHEYYSGPVAWTAELRRLGIRVLSRDRVVIGDAGPGGATLDLAGVDDWSHRPGSADGRWPALEEALAGRDPDRSLVLLAHQPRGVPAAVKAGVELQLSGHTHGGQIYPWNFVVGAVYRYVRGLYPASAGAQRGQIFVSCGTGYWGPPLRLGAPAEIARLVLT